jgi:endonuclease YncB( thermonuclease family)
MGWFFRKSFRVFPGVRLNVGKRTSVSVGPPGIKYNIGPGRDRFTVGIPGTGLYHTQQLGSSSANNSEQPQSAVSSRHKTRTSAQWLVAVFVIVGLGLLYLLGTSQKNSERPIARELRGNELVGPPAPKANQKQSNQPEVQKIVGKPRVVDGDTVNIRANQIRLEGIDAPETEQVCTGVKGDIWQCGRTATLYLSSLVEGEDVSCEKSGEDQYGRTLATCVLSDGTNLNAKMVRDGFALAFIRYSTRYLKDEREAKNAKRGLWAGKFDAPWDWRAKSRLLINNPAAAPQMLLSQQLVPPRANCSIKGNINRSGERIYHVPGSKWYDRTQINERSGERWFCSVAEAEAAGWRASRGRN